MRLFIAINFDKAVLRQLTAYQDRIRQIIPGEYTKAQNLHLTLVFMGELPQKYVPVIGRVMNSLDTAPLSLTLSGLGSFERAQGSILWLGIEQNLDLERLQQTLSGRLANCGFPIEALDKRPFTPHLTLARKAKSRRGLDLGTLAPPEPIIAAVDKISLMKSERIDGRLTYTEVFRRML